MTLMPRQKNVLDAIKAHWCEIGRSPSFKDLEARLGMGSTALRRHLGILEAKGLIAPRRPRKPCDIYLAKPVGEAA